MEQDIFKDVQGRAKVLRGVTIYSNSTWLAELAGRVGFETVWIEMEHGPAGFEKVETLCLAAEVGGAIPAVRVSDSERTHILRALEVGARIVIVPMVNIPDQAREVVEYGKFPPVGKRGYNTRSRGVQYGLNGAKTDFSEANSRTFLFAQIETQEAIQNFEAICGTEGLAGIFIGPGDLSASLGCMGDLNNPEIINTITECIRRARAMGKHAGILVAPGALLDAAIQAGCDLAFFGGDVMDLASGWKKLLNSVKVFGE
jgi:2-keto-3-deoxy-L-rhamnonate aldolase RhmA